MSKRIFTLKGMHCAACAAAIEKAVKKIPGCEEAYVNFAANELSVPSDSASDADILKAIEKAGFSGERQTKITPSPHTAEEKSDRVRALRDLGIAWGLGIILTVNCHYPFLDSFKANGILQMLLLTGVALAGRRFFSGGIPALFRGRPDMNSLIAVGVISGFLYSLIILFTRESGHLFFDAGAMIIMLVMLGKYLENSSRYKAAGALRELAALAPESAIQILPGGREEKIPYSAIRPGMTFKVLPGMKVPADGIVLSGNSSCDESMFNGEAMPAEKKPGSSVTGGSINNESVLLIEAQSCGDDSMLSKIIAAVKEAQGSRAPIARIADKAASVFVWAVLGIAAITFCVHLILGHGAFSALNHALGVLVIACPCSLGLATPIALICGTGRGAKSGILIKSGAVMEELSQIKALLFDKTGTLTTGIFSVTNVEVLQKKWNRETLLAVAASLEKDSPHPIGKAIVSEAASGMIEVPEASDCVTIPGKGIKGRIGNVFFEVTRPDKSEAAANGQSTVVILENALPIGIISLSDTLRQEAFEAIRKLEKMGFSIAMLTGDTPGAAAAAAGKLEIDDYYGGLFPTEKSALVKKLREKYGKIAMVGDGINDAPALAAANVGIAMGKGTSAAIESADAVLLTENLQKLPELFELSRKTMRCIRQNLFWAFAYNGLGIPLAAGVFSALLPWGEMSPAFCAAAMGASSVTVVLNALRLRKK